MTNTVSPVSGQSESEDEKTSQQLQANNNYGDISHEEHCSVKQQLLPGSTIVVVLFGWAGCRERYLSKYAKMYAEAGVSTIRFTVPISKVRSFATYRTYALEMYEKVFDKELPYDVYFHVFSMNGCSLFTALWDLFGTVPNEKTLKQKVKGVIYDSSPANVSPHQSARAISFATMPPSTFHPAVRESYRAILLTFFSLHRAMIWVRSHFEGDVYEKNFAFFRMLAMDDLPVRQLFVYGPADDICSDHSIEAFANVQKEAGKEVHLVILPDSPHCQHLRTHPEKYAENCLKFVVPAEVTVPNAA